MSGLWWQPHPQPLWSQQGQEGACAHTDTHPTCINILDWPKSSFGFFHMLLGKTQMNFLGQIQQINTNIFGGLYKQKKGMKGCVTSWWQRGWLHQKRKLERAKGHYSIYVRHSHSFRIITKAVSFYKWMQHLILVRTLSTVFRALRDLNRTSKMQ